MSNETVLTPQNQDNQQTDDNQQQQQQSGDGGQQQQEQKLGDWRDSLPADIRGEKMFENIKGKDAAEVIGPLAKGYRDAQKLVGGSLGKLPAKDAKPEEIKAWQEANLPKLREAGLIEAAPAAPDKYTAKVIKDGSTLDGPYEAIYKQFHQLGLTDKQAQGILDLYVSQQTQLGGSAKETMAALEKEWGAGVATQIKAAQQAVRSVGGSELIDVLEQTGLGNHPALIKAFAKVGAILGEDDPVFRDTVQTGEADAKAQRDKIMKDKSHAYWDQLNPGHKAAVAEVARLNQIIFAQES